MYTFKNGTDEVRVGMDKVHVEYTMRVDEQESSVHVSLPSFNIHFYVENKGLINEQVPISINSFLRYWLKIQGFEAFVKHMLSLGFTIDRCKKVLGSF